MRTVFSRDSRSTACGKTMARQLRAAWSICAERWRGGGGGGKRHARTLRLAASRQVSVPMPGEGPSLSAGCFPRSLPRRLRVRRERGD